SPRASGLSMSEPGSTSFIWSWRCEHGQMHTCQNLVAGAHLVTAAPDFGVCCSAAERFCAGGSIVRDGITACGAAHHRGIRVCLAGGFCLSPVDLAPARKSRV